MLMPVEKLAQAARQAAAQTGSLSARKKEEILRAVAEALIGQQEGVLAANAEDCLHAEQNGRDAAFVDRLRLDAGRVEALVQSLREIADLPDPVGKIIEEKTLENGVLLRKRRVPIGVIAIIYEARPGVTLEAAALCLKSGNVVLLKGGSDALATNMALARLYQSVLSRYQLPMGTMQLITSTDRTDTEKLLALDKEIDVVIPRGGSALVRRVAKLARMPVLYHADGIDHIYVDFSANQSMAIKLCLNSKINRPATCNSVDTILVHRKIAPTLLPALCQQLQSANVVIHGSAEVQALLEEGEQLSQPDFEREFLSLAVNLQLVNDVEEAADFIQQHGSRHTEGIVAEDQAVIDCFLQRVDAATVCVNCSTRLNDGGVFGMGAEMGIATGKLHARGPVGLQELTTYQWVMLGSGQVRG